MSFPGNDPVKPTFGQPQPSPSIPNPYGDRGPTSTTYAPSPASGYGGPYGPPNTPSTPAGPGKNYGCLIAGIVGGVFGVILLMCAGCLGLGFFALEGEHQETARKLSVNYRNDPKVKEHVGEIQKVEYNWSASMAREDDYDVYTVKGDKGEAQFVVEAPESYIDYVKLQNNHGEWELDLVDDVHE